jgi:hypothetical protein
MIPGMLSPANFRYRSAILTIDFETFITIVDSIKSSVGGEVLRKDGVADGTRTRNNQNHNLGIYH